jgi:mRNA interferase MazF
LREAWILVDANHPQFLETGLKKTSLIRADKIATVSLSVFQNQLGHLPLDILNAVHMALLRALNLNLLT